MDQLDQETIKQKQKTAVNHLTIRAFMVGSGIGGLFFFVGIVMLIFSISLSSTLLGLAFLGFGLLFGAMSLLRAWQMRSWPLLLVQATVLKKRQVSFRGTRYYLHLKVLQAESISANGRSPSTQPLEPELDYMTSLTLFNQTQEGETARFICLPKAKQILERIQAI